MKIGINYALNVGQNSPVTPSVPGFFFIGKDRSISFMVLSKSTVSLLIVWRDNLSITESEVLKYPTSIVLVSIYFFSSINVCLIYLGTMILSTCICNCYVLLMKWLLLDDIMTFFVSCDNFWLKVYFVWEKYSYSCPLWLLHAWSIFYSFPSPLAYVLKTQVNLL